MRMKVLHFHYLRCVSKGQLLLAHVTYEYVLSVKETKMYFNDWNLQVDGADKFKSYKVVRKSDYFDPESHFEHDASQDKIKSDLIVETCEDMKHVATASLQPVTSNNTGMCKSL